MKIDDLSSWPPEIIRFLQQHHDMFLRWHERRYADKPVAPVRPEELDWAIYALDDLLRPYPLHGYHCTRLSEAEIAHILAEGMQPPNSTRLCARIDGLLAAGLIDPAIADKLRAEHGADEPSRTGMIWFCFYPPRFAGQSAAERLFRNWGGEALYAYHEREPVTGPALRSVGTPCLVEADVPIATFGSHAGLSFKVVRRFLIDCGLQTREPVEYEGNAKQPIPADKVHRIIKFPEADFLELTGCANWKPPL
jgi:hypothetical protein